MSHGIQDDPADPAAADAVVLDVDGTLVDTSYLHVAAWAQAFAAVGVDVPHWRIHRAIGMGGDRLVAHVGGQAVEDAMGDEIRDRHQEAFDADLSHVRPVPGAADLMAEMRRRRIRVLVASSGPAEQTDRLLEIAGGQPHLEDRSSDEDVDRSKPDSEAVDVVLERAGADRALVIGDSTWDMEAALRGGHRCVGVMSGGISTEELHRAGAEQVYVDAADLLEHLDALPVTTQEEHA